MRILFPICVCLGLLYGQSEPDGAGLERGTLPGHWATGGPDCATLPTWQVHRYNQDFYILRESGCTNYEKPFLFLFFGKERALLFDTGAGAGVDTAEPVMTLVAERKLPLTVAHTHAHGDHVSGDKTFAGMEQVTVVPATVEDTIKLFEIGKWPTDNGSIDLGGRVLDIIPIPGHEAVSIAVYDRRTGILLTGDSLYPGRLYVADFPQFRASIERLVEFTKDKPVAHVLGNHIEESATPYLDYPIRTKYQPEEHALALSRAHLLELLDGLREMNAHPVRKAFRDFTIWPK